jgi:hypothetical protein
VASAKPRPTFVAVVVFAIASSSTINRAAAGNQPGMTRIV